MAAEGLDTGDTAWMIVSTALVMMMTPAGLALFYGGMSRYKNMLNTFAMTMVAYCLGSVIWVMWGYTLAFGAKITLTFFFSRASASRAFRARFRPTYFCSSK